MDFSVIPRNLPYFWEGFLVTCQLTLLAFIGGLVIGTPLAVARASKRALPRYASLVLIEAVRGTPVLLLIFWIYFMLPVVFGIHLGAYAAGLAALTIFSAVYSAEIVRAGIQAVSFGHIEAGRASGLGGVTILRDIVLPQAFANMTPALISQAVMMYKTSSLVFVLGVVDLFRAATIIDAREYKSIEIYLFVGLIYLVPSTVFSRLSRRLERRRAIRLGL
jgi:glutamate/aspartate transport system permease protein